MKLAVGVELEGTLVDHRDVKILLGDKEGLKRTRDQVIAAVSHRITYVDENVKKVEAQFDALGTRVEKLLVIAQPSVETEEGMAIMDIHEVLDEDGNVIEATVNGKDPEAALRAIDPDSLGAFEKFLDEESNAAESSNTTSAKQPAVTAENPTVTGPVPSKEAPKLPHKPTSPSPLKNVIDDADSDVEEIMAGESGGFVKVLPDPEVKDNEWVTDVASDEPEDAALRAQMLSYSMSELGAVVAELNLEESGDYYGYEDYTDDEGYSEEEDSYGRTSEKVVTESYRREMERLQQVVKERETRMSTNKNLQPNAAKAGKKGVRFSEELDVQDAPKPAVVSELPVGAGIIPDEEDALPYLNELVARGELVNSGPTFPETAEHPKPRGDSLFKREKSVVVAATPAPAPPGILKSAPAPPIEKIPTSTLADSILERAPTTASNPVLPPAPPKKISRFMAAKLAAASDDSDDEPGPMMTESVIERSIGSSNPEPQAPDEMDVGFHRQEVANSFHKMRSNLMAKQGGFIETDEEKGIVPLDENAEPVKISRFKAARLRG